MKTITDHLGRKVTYQYPPKRIISLNPCITETLYFLDLDEQIAGRTRYCIFPAGKVEKAKIVGGTKDIDLEAIHEVKPDLIIAEKEENTKEIVETLEKYYPVYVAEVRSIADAYRMIEDISSLLDREEQGRRLVQTIKDRFQHLPRANGMKAAYVIWRNPYMVVGGDTYIHSVLETLGFSNPFANFEGRYPVVTQDDLANAGLDYLFLATEPFPFKDRHKQEFSQFLPNTKIEIVDGEMFWYGAKMVEAAHYFEAMLKK